MASVGLPYSSSSSKPPSPPLLVQPPPEDAANNADADEYLDLIDLDRPSSRASSSTSSLHQHHHHYSSSSNNNNWNDIDDLTSSRNNGFLSPDFAASPRRPSSRMSDTTAVDAVPPASPGGSPFNFQTQFMSTSPVRSVRYITSPS